MNKNVELIQELVTHQRVILWMLDWGWVGMSGVTTRLKYLAYDAQGRVVHHIPYSLETINVIASQKAKDDETVKENISSAECTFDKRHMVDDAHLLTLNDQLK